MVPSPEERPTNRGHRKQGGLMGVIDRIFGRQEQRAIGIDRFFDGPPGQYSPVEINQDRATQISAVYAAIRLISDTVGGLPLDAFQKTNGLRQPLRPKPSWIENPSPDKSVTRVELISQIVASLLTDGNAFIAVTRDSSGAPVFLDVLAPRAITVTRVDGVPVYEVTTPAGAKATYTQDEIIHIPLFRLPGFHRGLSPIDHLKATYGVAIAAEEYGGRFFGQNATPSGIVNVPGDLTEEQATSIRRNFARHHEGLGNAHRIAVLTGGAKFDAISITPEQAQFLELRGFQVEEIARIFRVPAHLLGILKPGAVSYASVELQAQEYVTFTIKPILDRLETGLARLIPGGDTYIRFNVEGLLRADTKSRYDALASAINVGWISVDEARRIEDLPPLPDGQGGIYRMQLGFSPAGTAETQGKANIYDTLIKAGMTPDEAARISGI
jgi:HK97 family phage portal protein